MILYLIRHGETDWNKVRRIQGYTDIPLNENGRALARQTALGMKDIAFDLVITSPLSRAKETAEIICEGRDIPMIVTDEVKEFCFGAYEGMSVLEGEGRILNETFFHNTARFVPAPDGETMEHLMKRTGDFLSRLYQDPNLQDKTVLVSTHGAAVTAMINNIKNQTDIADFWKMGVPKNCAVAKVEVTKGIPCLMFENKVFF